MIYKNTRRFSQKTAFVLSWILLFQAFLPVSSFALTSGPSQPEFNSFEPVGTTQMVDPFTGSFVYNIPLFELPGPDGGYPFNLSYKPDGNINSESGPFGYGWTINPGIISRDVRGIPDDHNGDLIKETNSMKDNWTAGIDVGSEFVEALGLSFLDAGFGLYYNSYRGVGVNASLGLSLSISNSQSSVRAGLSFDSQEGFNVAPSMTIGGIFKASTSISARRGMSGLSLTVSPKLKKDKVGKDKEGNETTKPQAPGMSYIGTNISFAGGDKSPSMTLPWNTTSLSGKVKLGGSIFGIFANASIGGNFSLQRLKKKGKETSRNTYGYLYSEMANDESLLDFSREKDGPINDNSPNIGIPMTSPDIYTATGQGMAGMFRPYRSDIGVVYDPKVSSIGAGGSFSLDAPVLHAGGSGNVNFSYNESGKWNNGLTNNYDFKTKAEGTAVNSNYETYFFKTQGEKVAEDLGAIDEYVGGEDPIRPNLSGGSYIGASTTVKNKRETRKPRGLVIQDFKNEIAQDIPLFNSSVYNGVLTESNFLNKASTPFNHLEGNEINESKKDHIGAFTSTDAKGVRYVYGIPAYNNKEESYMFSVDQENACGDPLVNVATSGGEINYKKNGTDKFYKKTDKAPFAHSYLLTSVLGGNYIDIDNNGPSLNDIGYWVKFNYAKVHDDFQWRSPYTKAFYDAGIKVRDNDNKGSFSYGEKEIWMLGTVETKTHVAAFISEPRQDGFEAPGVFANSGIGSKGLHKVTKIKLFTRSAWESGGAALRTVNFDYDYTISSNVPNSTAGSKLALSSVWFQSENSTRGENNKYIFDYGNFNPAYTETGFDRWGTYFDPAAPTNASPCGNVDFPYTKQIPGPGQSPTQFMDEMTENTSVWNLKEITLPSGSKINIEWEPHTYGYVQNQKATQMVKIHSVGDWGQGDPNDLYDNGGNAVSRKIYFEREPGSSIDDYLSDLPIVDRASGTKQIYIKARTKLFKNDGLNKYQDVSGYLDIESTGFYPAGNEANATHFYIEVKKLKPGNSAINHHPISVLSWQFMKSQLPEKLLAMPAMPELAGESEGKGIVKKLATSISSISNFFKGFYGSCVAKGFAKHIDLDNSYIKLCVPDGEKFGAGARVAKIELEDAWETNSTYGQQYTYYDGVVANEPSIGGDENALRYAKSYPTNLLLATDEVNFFEYPVNENLYPGPSIGYGKVEVKSLATYKDEQKRSGAAGYEWLPDGISTTGKVVHEFYTAKDFPVISEDTEIAIDKSKLKIPVFPMGSYNEEFLTTAQGYSIIKNDMHGKPKKVSNFGQDVNGDFIPDPYNFVKYNYKHKTITHNGKEVMVLDNEAEVLLDYDPIASSSADGPFKMDQGPRLIGVDYEMINDMRQNNSFATDLGGEFNVDFIPFFIPPLLPLPSLWFTVAMDRVVTKTAATNKMIFKSGILESMEAYDGGSNITTENLLFDQYTGEALLTKLTNEYGDDIYNLGVPGHMVYDGMGPAYENTGITLSGTMDYDATCGLYAITIPDDDLRIGDEFWLSTGSAFSGMAVFEKRGIPGNTPIVNYFRIDDVGASLTGESADLTLVRSGNRNQVMANVSSISAMEDPTKNIIREDCTAEFETANPEDIPGDVIIVMDPVMNRKVDLINRLLSSDFDNDGTEDFFDLDETPLISNPDYTDILGADPSEVLGPATIYRYDNEWFCPGYGNIPPRPSFIINSGDNGWGATRLFRTYNNSNSPSFLCGNTEDFQGCNDFALEGWEGLVSVSNPAPCTEDVDRARGTIELNFEDEDGNLLPPRVFSFFHSIWHDVFSFGNETQVIYNPVVEDITVEQFRINSVLNISSSTLNKQIIENEQELRVGTESNSSSSLSSSRYSSLTTQSNSHNWTEHKAFGYLDERTQSGNNLADPAHPVVLQTDGVIDGVSLFNFKDPFFADCMDSKWVETAQITNYDNDNEVESKDALGIYSSALYGYQDNLATAVAQNARYLEIAYEGFEEFNNTQTSALTAQQPNEGAHIDFVSDAKTTYQSFELISGRNNTIVIDHPFDSSLPSPFLNLSKVDLSIQFRDGSFQMISANVIGGGTQGTPQGNTLMVLDYEGCEPTLADGSSFEDAVWKGTVHIPKQVYASGLQWDAGSAYVFSNNLESSIKAHTGSRYLSLPANGSGLLGLQTLRLTPLKEYHVSVWVARDPDKIHPEISGMVKINGEDLDVVTAPIDGWVKLEKTFIGTSYFNVLSFHADPVTKYNSRGQASTVNANLYVDDIRIQPAKSSMVTYVYDPENYRLQATLDENNYATFYEYDHEGRLIVLKKETERGVKTIQHSQNHLADQ